MAIGKQNIIAADGNGNHVTVKNLALNDTYSFSPNVLFNTWFGWTSQTGGSLSGAPFGFPRCRHPDCRANSARNQHVREWILLSQTRIIWASSIAATIRFVKM